MEKFICGLEDKPGFTEIIDHSATITTTTTTITTIIINIAVR
jgi:hypothetical protein